MESTAEAGYNITDSQETFVKTITGILKATTKKGFHIILIFTAGLILKLLILISLNQMKKSNT
jgi:hypothetical protein